MMMFNIPSFIINNFATLNTANNYIIFCSCSDVRAKLMHRKVFTNYEYNIINKGVRDCQFGCLLFNHATTEPIYLKLRKLKVEERLYCKKNHGFDGICETAKVTLGNHRRLLATLLVLK